MNKRKEGDNTPIKIYTDRYNEEVLDIYKDFSRTIKDDIKIYLKKVSRWN
jgi:hypothetical protein